MEWVEYYGLEPWGDNMADARNGQLCSLLANINRDPKNNPNPYKQSDFMLTFEREAEKELSDEEVDQHLKGIFGA